MAKQYDANPLAAAIMNTGPKRHQDQNSSLTLGRLVGSYKIVQARFYLAVVVVGATAVANEARLTCESVSLVQLVVVFAVADC